MPNKEVKGSGSTIEMDWQETNVSHLKVFGALCFKHVPDARRKKLDDKSKAMILVGYHSTGVYKLY